MFAKDIKFLTKGGIRCFSRSSLHFYFMRGQSLIELTGHDNSVAGIISWHIICPYMYCCIHST